MPFSKISRAAAAALAVIFLDAAASADTPAPGIPRFDLPRSGLELQRPTRPGAFFDVVGRRAAVFGYENRPFEAWAYPLKLVDDFKLGFQLISQAVIDGWRLGEVPGFCRYFPEASQNPFRGSVVYGWGTLTESFRVFKHRLGLGTPRVSVT